MAPRVRLGLVQLAMSESIERNVRNAIRGVEEAAAKGSKLVCLPELFAWRYFPASRESRQEPVSIPGPLSRSLSAAARKNGVVLVAGSLFEKSGRLRYNTCLTFDERGRTLSKYRKVHIPQDEHYYEQDYFAPGSGYSVARTVAGRVGTLICFDQWYPEAARANALMGAQILCYPTAIGWVNGIDPVEGDWKQAWEAVQVGHAIANSLVVCAVNRVGREGDTTFWGGSFVCDQFGKILVRAGDDEGVFTADVDLALGKLVEDGWGFARNRKPRTYKALAR